MLTHTRRNAVKPTHRLRRWLSPLTLEILEDRRAPGSLLFLAGSGFVSLDQPQDPDTGTPESPATWESMPLAVLSSPPEAPPEGPGPTYVNSQDASAAPVHIDNEAEAPPSQAFDGRNPLNVANLFQAFDDVFAEDAAASSSTSSGASSAADGGGEGGGGPESSGGGGPAATLSGGASLAGAGSTSSAAAAADSAMMNATPYAATPSAAMVAPAPAAPAGTVNSPISSAQPGAPAPSVVGQSAGAQSRQVSSGSTPPRRRRRLLPTPRC
jgi:hypothetical protein